MKRKTTLLMEEDILARAKEMAARERRSMSDWAASAFADKLAAATGSEATSILDVPVAPSRGDWGFPDNCHGTDAMIRWLEAREG